MPEIATIRALLDAAQAAGVQRVVVDRQARSVDMAPPAPRLAPSVRYLLPFLLAQADGEYTLPELRRVMGLIETGYGKGTRRDMLWKAAGRPRATLTLEGLREQARRRFRCRPRGLQQRLGEIRRGQCEQHEP